MLLGWGQWLLCHLGTEVLLDTACSAVVSIVVLSLSTMPITWAEGMPASGNDGVHGADSVNVMVLRVYRLKVCGSLNCWR